MRVPARAVPVSTTTTDLALVGGSCVLYGYSIVETTGSAAATFNLYDGSGTTGTLVATAALAQGVSSTVWFGVPGIELSGGLFLDVVTGSVRGACWVVPGEHVLSFELEQGYAAQWRGDA